MATRQIIHVENKQTLLRSARWCDSFGSKLRGFTFKRSIREDEGLVLVGSSDSRAAAAIHMLFVFCELGVVWVNDAGQVVDTVLAKPWRLSYAPPAPARYVIEGHPHLLELVNVGDRVAFLALD